MARARSFALNIMRKNGVTNVAQALWNSERSQPRSYPSLQGNLISVEQPWVVSQAQTRHHLTLRPEPLLSRYIIRRIENGSSGLPLELTSVSIGDAPGHPTVSHTYASIPTMPPARDSTTWAISAGLVACIVGIKTIFPANDDEWKL
jgi:hypothetical protein